VSCSERGHSRRNPRNIFAGIDLKLLAVLLLIPPGLAIYSLNLTGVRWVVDVTSSNTANDATVCASITGIAVNAGMNGINSDNVNVGIGSLDCIHAYSSNAGIPAFDS